VSSGKLTEIKLVAAEGNVRITFEPLGEVVELKRDEVAYLRVPVEAIAATEIYVWPNGISVWLPYPGESDYVVVDANGDELLRF
jgi:2'-5' RNA ligase